MCIRDSYKAIITLRPGWHNDEDDKGKIKIVMTGSASDPVAVSYTHLRAHETVLDLVCRLLLEKKKETE